jgi:hypothetical protein
MRPAHIKVFDGLRITTEHMDHLQGAMHSALQEIRGILGLGRVYSGFEVNAEDDRNITVLPGLAFDRQGNRLVCDEPKTLQIAFEPGEESKFVCIKHDQVEDGQVEGQYTMIWDSCSVTLRPSLPGPEDNLLPVATVMKPADDGGGILKVVSLLSTEQGEAPVESSGEAAGDGAEIAAPGPAKGIPPPEPAAAAAVAAPAPAIEGDAAAAGKPSMNVAEAPLVETTPTTAKPWRLQIRQGVARLAVEDGSGNYLKRVLLEPLKKKLKGGETGADAELMFTLAEKEIALDFPVSGASLQIIINAGLGAAGSAAEEGRQRADLKCQVTAHGESSFAGEAVSQFGLSTICPYAAAGSSWSPWPVSELTESGVAHLPLATLWKPAEDRGPEAAQSPLQHLQLLIKTDKTTGSGFKVVCNLLWRGGITEEIIRSLESQDINFTWEILAAWKALGESQG